MSNKGDRTYYSRRASDEGRFGDVAVHAGAAAAHYELAYRYSVLATKSQPSRFMPALIGGGKDERSVQAELDNKRLEAGPFEQLAPFKQRNEA